MLAAIDPKKILSVEECERERTPQELAEWVKEKNALFARTKGGVDYVTSRRGLARKFIDEIYPLGLLMQHLFYRRADVVCKPTFDGDSDATVVDYGDRPLRLHRLVFKHAIYRYKDYLRKVYLSDQARPLASGKKRRRGRTHTGVKANEKDAVVDDAKVMEKGLQRIARVAQRQSGRAYGKDTSLVIVFDDMFAFRSSDGLLRLEEFLEAKVLPMELDFGKLFLLGWSGRMLLGFALTDNDFTTP